MQSYRAQEKPIDDRIMVTRHDTRSETDNPRQAQDTEVESATAWALRAALLARDVQECRLQAERAGAQRDITAVAPLTTLLQPPHGLRMRVKRTKWAQTRLSAVRALEQIGTEAALPPLARALLDPSPLVQEAAAHALAQAGPQATSAVTSVLYNAGNWPLSGMKRLVTTLGQLQTPQANAALVPLILGSQPAAPRRWDALMDISLRTGYALIIGLAVGVGCMTGSIVDGLITALIMLLLVGMLWLLFAVVCVTPIRRLRESYERKALASLTVEGLCRQDDKTYLPALIEGVFGYYHRTLAVRSSPSRHVVLHLLRLVNSEDTARLSNSARLHLMEALGRSYDNDMDMALLRVLEWAGDGQVLPRVERIASRGATEELRAEAARILPVLQERQRNAQAPAMLLRPSQAQPAHPEQLLRPGYAADTTPAIQLLRPTQEE